MNNDITDNMTQFGDTKLYREPPRDLENHGFVLIYKDEERMIPLATVRIYGHEIDALWVRFIGFDVPTVLKNREHMQVVNRGRDLYRIAAVENTPELIGVRIERDDSGDADAAGLPSCSNF